MSGTPDIVVMSSRRRWLLLAIPCALYVLGALLLGSWIIDDAGISYAYAHNLAGGDGFVSQPGRAPVEGFSNLLWVLVMVPTYWLGLFDPVVTPKVLGVLAVIASFAIVQRVLEQRTGSPWPGLVVTLVLAACPPIVIWSASGLENGLFLLLVIVLFAQLVERGPRWQLYAGACTAGLALTRPDGLVFVVAGVVVCLADALPAPRDGRAVMTSVARYAGAFVAIAAPWWIYRAVTFGLFWPQTYYAKRTSTSLASRLGELLAHPGDLVHALADLGRAMAGPLGPLLLAASLVGVVVLAVRRRLTAELRVAVVLQVFSVGAYLVLDADWMREHRFATAAIATSILTTVLAAFALVPNGRRLAVGCAACGVVMLAAFVPRLARFAANPTTPYADVERTAHRFNAYADALQLTGGSILAADLGGQLVESRLTVYDAAGLCEPDVVRTLKRGGPVWHYDHPEFSDWVFETIKPTFITTHKFWSNVTALEHDARFARDYVAIDAYRDEYVVRTFGRHVRSGDFVRRDALGPAPGGLDRLRALAFSPRTQPFAIRIGERLGLVGPSATATATELVAVADAMRTRGWDGEPDPNRAVTLLRRALGRPGADRGTILPKLASALDEAMRNTEARVVWAALAKDAPRDIPLAARLESDGADGIARRGVTQYAAQRFEDVIQLSRVALHLDPRSGSAMTNLCASLFALERWDESVPVCEQALALQPNAELARNNLAWARSGQSASTLVTRALAQYEAKQYDDAVRSSQQALEVHPSSAAAANNLCASLSAAGRWPEAIAACERGVAAHPGHALLANNLAWARNGAAAAELNRQAVEAYGAKKFDRVVTLSRAAIELDPRSADAWNNQCAALCEQRRWSDALPICDQAAALAPESATAKANLAWARSGAATASRR